MTMQRVRSCGVVAGVLGAVLVAAISAPATEIDPEVLQQALDASVLIRVQRVFMGSQVPTNGSGFFVHPDGYILTNWHVVAEQVELNLFGTRRETSTTTLGIDVVVDSGGRDELMLPAKIVTMDRESDLALLKVDHRPRSTIDVTDVVDVRLTQPIWTVGFPFGSSLAMERSAVDANPEVSVSFGRVTSLRRDDDGDLKSVQTDAALNPGNSGGAVIDADGRLVGVVKSGIPGASGVAFAVAPPVLRRFVAHRGVRFTFKPTVVYFPPEPIVVTAEPLLVDLNGVDMFVELEGADIETTSAQFIPDDDGRLIATLQVAGALEGIDERPVAYTATVRAERQEPGEASVRHFRLDAIRLGQLATLDSARPAEKMFEDRKIVTNDIDIEDFARTENGKHLSEVAATMSLPRSESGSPLIDNHLLEKSRSVEFVWDPEWYASLTRPVLREKVRRFDELLFEINGLRPVRDSVDYGQWYSSAYYRVRRNLYRLEMELGRLASELEQQEVCRCYGQVWYYCSRAVCAEPESVADVMFEELIE